MRLFDSGRGPSGRDRTGADASDDAIRRRLRYGAVAGVGVTLAASVSVLYSVVDIAGTVFEFAAVLAGAIALATLLAWRGPRGRAQSVAALAVAALLLGGGLVAYFATLLPDERAIVTPAQILSDTGAMLTGMSVVQLLAAGAWALGITPAPAFLAWYLALRGEYRAAVVVSGALLGLFVLTGDAGIVTTLVGVVGAGCVLALESLVRTLDGAGNAEPVAGGTQRDTATLGRHVQTQLELLTVVLAAVVLVSATVGGTIGSDVSSGGGSGGDTVDGTDGVTQASLVNTSDEIAVSGPISLSPEVRLLVHSDQSAYWRTAAYDRYTGDGWVRTGQANPYEDGLAAPPGQTERVEQTVEPRTRLGAMPAANQPVAVDDAQASRTQVTTQGTIEPSEPLAPGDNYTVVSRQPEADPDALREADDYGESVDRYRQLPESTPDRVAERASEVAGDQPTAFDTAVAVERHLESTKNYSTLVRRPDGDVADGFLFEMDAGYCTYFATTMAVMLRTQDVPARVAVGYTSGQRLETENGPDTHVVRGYDAHAWVEVYFEGVGWVAFDPTPADPRRTLEYQRLRNAREEGTTAGIDAAGSSEEPISPAELNASNVTGEIGQLDAANASTAASESTDGGATPLPDARTIGLWIVGLVGATAITRRRGWSRRARGAVARYYQPRRSPSADVERAWQRIESELRRRHRPREPSESARSYVRSLDANRHVDRRVHEVLDRYERARYGGQVDRESADSAVEHADALTRRGLPLVGRRYQ